MNQNHLQQNIHDISDYDEHISLFKLIPSGKGIGKKHLELIVDSVLNSNFNRQRDSPRPFSVLVNAPQGGKTFGKVLLKALGIEEIRVISSYRLNSVPYILNYFYPVTTEMGYIIDDIEYMPPLFHLLLDEILESGQFTIYHTPHSTYPITGNIVLLSHHYHLIPPLYARLVDHVVKFENYNKTQIQKIIRQRLNYANLQATDMLINKLVGDGTETLFNIIRKLRVITSVALSEGRTNMIMKDYHRGMEFMFTNENIEKI